MGGLICLFQTADFDQHSCLPLGPLDEIMCVEFVMCKDWFCSTNRTAMVYTRDNGLFEQVDTLVDLKIENV